MLKQSHGLLGFCVAAFLLLLSPFAMAEVRQVKWCWVGDGTYNGGCGRYFATHELAGAALLEVRHNTWNQQNPTEPETWSTPMSCGDPDYYTVRCSRYATWVNPQGPTTVKNYHVADVFPICVGSTTFNEPRYHTGTGLPSCVCPPGTTWYAAARACVPYHDRLHDKPQECAGFGNPIYPLNGSKGSRERVGRWSMGSRAFLIAYDSRRKVPSKDSTLSFDFVAPASFGELWSTSFHRSLSFQTSSTGTAAVQASRGAGNWTTFVKGASNSTYAPDADVTDNLVQTASGWRYYDRRDRSEEIYDATGKLSSARHIDGSSLSFSYSDPSTPTSVAPATGLLIAIQDQFGRTVKFRYEQPADVAFARIKEVVEPDGGSVGIVYDASNNLTQLNWPDGSSRRFLYERSDLHWALTGVMDESGVRSATYGYDAEGRAVETQRAGGAEHYVARYGTPPQWNVVETYDPSARIIWRDHSWQLAQDTTLQLPDGSVSTLEPVLIQGMPRIAAQSQPPGSGCLASTSQQNYDPNGSLASRDDFNGNRSCFAHDLGRNLEITRVEGLSAGASCTVTNTGSTMPPGTRKTSTTWHSDWPLAVRRSQLGQITTYVYNGQPDPFAGNALASCAPSSATLPDGKPIAVLCRQVEQATTDADGSSGFAASLQPDVPAREQRWTYNAFGQVLTYDGPQASTADTTVYSYYSDTAFSGADPNAVGHTLGDLQSITNPAGHVTQFPLYNKAGRVLRSIDANGVVTDYEYDARQRLTRTATNGRLSRYDYWPTGLVRQTTEPDGSFVAYRYDDAHRLVEVSDQLGNTITYTLDNAGNRTAETSKDGSGTLRNRLTRTLDALNRVQELTGRGAGL